MDLSMRFLSSSYFFVVHMDLGLWLKRFIFSANVRDDLLGTAGTSGAAKPSTQSDSGGELGRSLR